MSVCVQLGDTDISIGNHILVEVTKLCNNRCRHCFTGASPTADKGQPTLLQLDNLFRSIQRLGVGAVTLSGGEPLLRKDIDRLVEALPEELQIWLFTSGVGMDLSRLEKWMETVSGFAVSIDGGERQHNYLRRSRRSFQENLGFMKQCAVLGARCQLQSMVLRGGFDQIQMIVELGETLGVERILFSHISPDGRGADMETEQLNAAELDGLHQHITTLQKQTEVTLRTNLMPRELVDKRFPPVTLHILPDGKVLPWYGVPKSYALGSLGDYGWDLEALLRSSRMGLLIKHCFSRAKGVAQHYSGEFVPVDDLLVNTFREPVLCK
ncbi:MAG: radical SAM protein [Chromatiales bacterium]|nr:radical SAM protein [Chromatiales bacterium]